MKIFLTQRIIWKVSGSGKDHGFPSLSRRYFNVNKFSSRFQEFQSCEESNISVSRSSGLQLDLGKQLLTNFLCAFFFFKVFLCIAVDSE
jgi:hypothetical protein